MYEPWFITHWSMLPWFDVRFRGYGMNKIAHVASLNLYNFTFLVYHAAWIVHRPHSDTNVGAGAPIQYVRCSHALQPNGNLFACTLPCAACAPYIQMHITGVHLYPTDTYGQTCPVLNLFWLELGLF